MAIVLQPPQIATWAFSSISNYLEGHVAGRKRGRGTEFEGEMQAHRSPIKRLKVVETLDTASDLSNGSQDTLGPHEFLAGDWRFEPRGEPTRSEVILEDAPSIPVDVEKVISLLLEALNAQNTDEKPAAIKSANDNNTKGSYHRPVTSPLSGSPDRMPFVRKVVGGSCHGKVEAGLQRWVLCKNHYDDIRAYHPSCRSAEWIEALHEMGWENLHPTYMSQSQQTFETLTTFSASCDDWIDVDAREQDKATEVDM